MPMPQIPLGTSLSGVFVAWGLLIVAEGHRFKRFEKEMDDFAKELKDLKATSRI